MGGFFGPEILFPGRKYLFALCSSEIKLCQFYSGKGIDLASLLLIKCMYVYHRLYFLHLDRALSNVHSECISKILCNSVKKKKLKD